MKATNKRNRMTPRPSKVTRYHTRLDSKKRIVLRGAEYEYYEVQQKKNGSFLLTPKVLEEPYVISRRTLQDIEESMANLKKGIVGRRIDPTTLLQKLDAKRK
jgi:hypothetical protein